MTINNLNDSVYRQEAKWGMEVPGFTYYKGKKPTWSWFFSFDFKAHMYRITSNANKKTLMQSINTPGN